MQNTEQLLHAFDLSAIETETRGSLRFSGLPVLPNWLVPGPSERLRLRKQGGHCLKNNSWDQGLASTGMCTHTHFVLLHINTQKHICTLSYIRKITVNWRSISFALYSGRSTSSNIFEVPVYSRCSPAEVGQLVHKESWEEYSKRRK